MVREKWFTGRIAAVALTGLLPLALPGVASAQNIDVAASQTAPTDTTQAKSQTASKDTASTESQPSVGDSSLAGVGKKANSIGLRGTYYIAQGSDNIRLYGGIQARHHFHKAFALELSADYRQENYNKDTKNVTSSIDVIPVQLSLLAYLMPGSRFSPFLLAGPGYYYTHLISNTRQDNVIQHRFGAHAGGGVQYFLNDCVSIDATYRYVWMQSLQETLRNSSIYSINDSGSQITFGLNWHF